MNLKQRIVVWTGLALIIAMALYPPWIQSFKPSVELADGIDVRIEPSASCYHWIFSPLDRRSGFGKLSTVRYYGCSGPQSWMSPGCLRDGRRW